MKKFLSLVIVLVIVFTMTSVMAENELTFQGVPWFSSPDETIKHLTGSQFIANGQSPALQTAKKDGTDFFSHIGVYKKDKKVPYRYVFKKEDAFANNLLNQTVWDNGLCATIAKQTIKNVSFFYTATDNPQLIEVCIWFDKDAGYELKAVYDALVSAYGKPNASRYDKEYIWLGANNTIVILYNNDVVFATLDGLSFAGNTEPVKMKDTGF